jgi:hypothetical protein
MRWRSSRLAILLVSSWEMPQFEGEREVENWFLKRGFKVEWI